jgi:glycosyltransferase involved in cell wall biosynthesis
VKILLLGNYVNDAQESMQRFATFMAEGLAQAGHDVQLLKPPPIFGALRPSQNGVGKWLGYLDKFGCFPLVLKSAVKKADVVHVCDQGNSFYTQFLKSVPNLVTCHDLLAVRSARGEFPQNRTRWTGRQYQSMVVKGLTGAQHIACASEATRKDVLRIVGIREHRVSRVYNSLSYPYSRMPISEAASRLRSLSVEPTDAFLLHVGGNQWYKNRLGVLRIFSHLVKLTLPESMKLVLVGKPWTAEMRQFVVANDLGKVTLELTDISNENLRALYSTAHLMLFPSLEEGFGWPIIEAQACGCPVATSDRSPMDEVAGTAGIYIDPEDLQSAAVVLKSALEKIAGMRDASLRNAARFRAGMIDSYVSVYEQVCNEKAAARSMN